MPGQIKIDDGAGNYTVLTNGGSLGSDKTITIPNTTGTMALTSDISAGGLTVADQYDITSNITSTQTVITNWARPTGTLQGNLGSGVSVSSGIFSFPSTGFYYVSCFFTLGFVSGSPGYMGIEFYTTDDDFSSSDKLWNISVSTPSNQSHMAQKSVILDITDTANQKVKLTIPTEVGSAEVMGATTETRSAIQFFKLGDT